MSAIVFEQVAKSFGPVRAVAGCSLEIADGSFLAILGPSGCGKTTLLRMLGGFLTPDAGRILIGGRDVTHLPPFRRNLGFVFQSYALFPHLTIADNVAFGLRMRRLGAAEIAARVRKYLELVRLPGAEDRYPDQLSGGQQQRIALARALAIEPDVLLLDEPLSALDRKLREEMQAELKEIQAALGVTTLLVTHDQEEALTMADRIVVMSAGQVEQVGPPEEIYEAPRTRFVADFVGVSNFFEGAVAPEDRSLFRTRGGTALRIAPNGHAPEGGVILRPEKITVHRSRPAGTPANLHPARVVRVLYQGQKTRVDLTLADLRLTAMVPNARRGEALAPNDEVFVEMDPEGFRGLAR